MTNSVNTTNSDLTEGKTTDSSQGRQTDCVENKEVESNEEQSREEYGNDRDDLSHSGVPKMSLLQEAVFAVVVMCAQVFTQAGIAQANVSPIAIGGHFNDSNHGKLSWFVASYSLTVGTFILIAGRLGDMYGHKNMLIFGFSWLSLWSLLAGISTYSTGIFFNICRGFQGIGSGFLLPNALAILGRTYPPGMKKNMVFAVFAACAPTGYTIGAAFTGVMEQFVSWSWAFYLMAIAGTVIVIAAFIVVPGHDEEHTEKQVFDWAGSITGVAGLVLVNVSWNQAPVVGWQTPYVYVLLIIGVLCIIAFVYIETKVAQPLVPIKAFTTRVAMSLMCVACGWGTFGIWVYYLWRFLQDLRGLSPLETVAQSVACISGAVASILTGYLMGRVPVSVIMLIAMCAFCTSVILLGTMPVHQTYWSQAFLSFLIAPFGMDMCFPSATIMLSESVPRKHQGIAGSLVATVVNYSISLSLGFAGTIVMQVSPGQTPQELLKAYRAATYFGIGLSGLGIIIAIISVIHEVWILPKNSPVASEEENLD